MDKEFGTTWATTLDEDRALLKSGTLPFKQWMAVVYRLNLKEIHAVHVKSLEKKLVEA
jgi:hypothetical protein